MIEYRIGDYVGARQDDPVFGKVTEIKYEGFMVTSNGEVTGPWPYEALWPDPSAHVDYPHHPGTLYDCPACEASGLLDYVSESSTTSTELDHD